METAIVNKKTNHSGTPPAVYKKQRIEWAEQVAPYVGGWNYPKKWPTGLIVHFTAGSGTEGEDDAEYMRHPGGAKNSWMVLVLGKTGRLFQGFDCQHGGAHCRTFHHRNMVGVEIVNAGLLKPTSDGGGTSWFGKAIPSSKCRNFTAHKNQVAGRYEQYTAIQEQKLIKLCLWYKEQEPEIFSFDNVLGHDEVCYLVGRPGAKNDPGGSLSMSMPEFRTLLKKLYAEGKTSADY